MYVYRINIVCLSVSSANAYCNLVALARRNLETRFPGVLMLHRPANSRLLSNLLQQEKEYSKQSLSSSSPRMPPWPRRSLGLILSNRLQAHWWGSMMLSNDMRGQWTSGGRRCGRRRMQQEEVRNIMRDWEILCVCAAFLSLFVFRVLYSPFFRVTRLMKASNSNKSGAGNVRESLLNHQRFPSGSQRFYRFALSCVVLAPSPTFDLQVHSPRHFPHPRGSKPAERTWQPKNTSWLSTTPVRNGLGAY